ncbi:hypothetical protein AVL59_32115 [Streptomyces griseochromogenes]|uniref:Uncharacterized protein n=1 Tax=Streptomyces griseochromogenes TaxID=68214 RepID=A0A1B1B433_9ACTN|nr:hypothetical protein AVL59_32115 [Streptomyces griseochromogenes]
MGVRLSAVRGPSHQLDRLLQVSCNITHACEHEQSPSISGLCGLTIQPAPCFLIWRDLCQAEKSFATSSVNSATVESGSFLPPIRPLSYFSQHEESVNITSISAFRKDCARRGLQVRS